MGWPKRAICEEAYAEMAMAGYEFDLTPEEMQWACRRLDMLMASWNSIGIALGYAQVVQPGDTDLDQDSGLALEANLAAVLNLALSLCAGKGKGATQTMLKSAREAYVALLNRTAIDQVRPQQLPVMPAGSGNRRNRYERPFTKAPDRGALGTEPGGNLDFVG